MTSKFRSFMQGMGTVIDIYPDQPTRELRTVIKRSDADALRSDWKKVGRDMLAGLDKAAHVQGQKEE